MIDRFLTQLKLIEKNVKQAKEDLDNFTPEGEIADTISPIFNLKFHEFYEENGLSQEEVDKDYFNEDMKKVALKVIEVNSVCKKLYNSLTVGYNEDGNATITCSIPGMLGYFLDKRKNGENSEFFRERDLILQSSVISLCTNLETFSSAIMTEFFLEIDNGSSLDKKSLSFKDLKAIGSVEDAKKFLIDEELDDLFRKSFKDWFGILDSKFNINKEFNKEENNIEEINELYQRRNLFVHTEGVVNDFYLKKCTKDLIGDLQKGDKISASPDYLLDKIKRLERFAWLMYYKFSQVKYRNDSEMFYLMFNNRILPYMKRNCEAIPMIYNSIMNNKKYTGEELVVIKINYLLFYRLNERLSEVKKDIENFSVNHYSNKYIMAKKIITNQDCFEEVRQYISTIDDDEFFSCLDWPLMGLIKAKEPYKEIFQKRINEIFDEQLDPESISEYVIIETKETDPEGVETYAS